MKTHTNSHAPESTIVNWMNEAMLILSFSSFQKPYHVSSLKLAHYDFIIGFSRHIHNWPKMKRNSIVFVRPSSSQTNISVQKLFSILFKANNRWRIRWLHSNYFVSISAFVCYKTFKMEKNPSFWFKQCSRSLQWTLNLSTMLTTHPCRVVSVSSSVHNKNSFAPIAFYSLCM